MKNKISEAHVAVEKTTVCVAPCPSRILDKPRNVAVQCYNRFFSIVRLGGVFGVVLLPMYTNKALMQSMPLH